MLSFLVHYLSTSICSHSYLVITSLIRIRVTSISLSLSHFVHLAKTKDINTEASEWVKLKSTVRSRPTFASRLGEWQTWYLYNVRPVIKLVTGRLARQPVDSKQLVRVATRTSDSWVWIEIHPEIINRLLVIKIAARLRKPYSWVVFFYGNPCQ